MFLDSGILVHGRGGEMTEIRQQQIADRADGRVVRRTCDRQYFGLVGRLRDPAKPISSVQPETRTIVFRSAANALNSSLTPNRGDKRSP